jgi:hypothetical protein
MYIDRKLEGEIDRQTERSERDKWVKCYPRDQTSLKIIFLPSFCTNYISCKAFKQPKGSSNSLFEEI